MPPFPEGSCASPPWAVADGSPVGTHGRGWWRSPPHGSDVSGPVLARLIDDVSEMVYRCRDEPGRPVSLASVAAAGTTGCDLASIEPWAFSWGADVVHPEDAGGYVVAPTSPTPTDGPVPPGKRPHAHVFDTREPVTGRECQLEGVDGRHRWISIDAALLQVAGHRTAPVNDAVPRGGMDGGCFGVPCDCSGRFYFERAGPAPPRAIRSAAPDRAIGQLD